MSKISWCDITWNPGIYGCSKVSEACRSCYAMSMAHRLVAMGRYPEGITRKGAHGPEWTGRVVVADEIQGLHSLPKRARKRVFVTSMSDVFHSAVPFEFIDLLFQAMIQRPHLTFQVLTKRPERALEWWERTVERWQNQGDWSDWGAPPPRPLVWPRNVWMGATVETQERANERILHLLRIPAAVRFLSCEPLLGPLDLRAPMERWESLLGEWQRELMGCATCGGSGYGEIGGAVDTTCHDCRGTRVGIQWVIAGGESGSRARPTDPRWFRSLRDQCAKAAVPFLFKQWGRWVGAEDMRVAADRGLVGHGWYEPHAEDGGHPIHHWPSDVAPGLGGMHPAPSYWVGPKQDPKTLDGVEHRAFPEDR